MKKFAGSFLIIFLIFSTILGAEEKRHSFCWGEHFSFPEDVEIDFDDDAIQFYSRGRNESVKITNDYELYVNGKWVSTSPSEKRLLRKYYYQGMKVAEFAKRISEEGTEIGVRGAEIGIDAVAGIVKVIFTGFDEEELEKDLERKAEELEERAEELEERAERLEEIAEELEEIHYELKDRIPELRRLEWY